MLDLRSLSDDEVIGWVNEARGYDRAMLIEALGYASGSSGVEFLRAQLEERGRGSSDRRVAAMKAIATRLGPVATTDLVPMLTGGNIYTQTCAAWALEQVDTGPATEHLLAWLRRRLRAAKRSSTWSHYEVSGVLRYALRVGSLQPLLALLDADGDRLQPDERTELDRAWPPGRRAKFRGSDDHRDGPDAAAVEAWYALSAVDTTPEDAFESLTMYVAPVITRLERRRQRSQRS